MLNCLSHSAITPLVSLLLAALLTCHWATGALIELPDQSPGGSKQLKIPLKPEWIKPELVYSGNLSEQMMFFADLHVCFRFFSVFLSFKKVECGWIPRLFDELLLWAHLLLQHHSGQPVPCRPPLQSHVPEGHWDRAPATVLQPEQATAQRWEADGWPSLVCHLFS